MKDDTLMDICQSPSTDLQASTSNFDSDWCDFATSLKNAKSNIGCHYCRTSAYVLLHRFFVDLVLRSFPCAFTPFSITYFLETNTESLQSTLWLVLSARMFFARNVSRSTFSRMLSQPSILQLLFVSVVTILAVAVMLNALDFMFIVCRIIITRSYTRRTDGFHSSFSYNFFRSYL